MTNIALPPDLTVRNCIPADHPRIIRVMTRWWGGRDLTRMLPRLFLEHFHDTSFVAETDAGQLAGFLVGFLSPANPEVGYIHFAGVHPEYRGKGLGTCLYNLFFGICRDKGRAIVRACTSPVNKGSIAFHRKMGFRILAGDTDIDGVPVTSDYNRPADHKVLFAYRL